VIDDRAAATTEACVAVEASLPSRAVEVRGDRVRLGQVVAALLENALKFTPADGRVRVGLSRRGGRAELTITDNGPGVPADVLARLFTPFVQGKNARGGLGLGLTIAHRLVELHGGTLEASNPPDGGARFVVRLALAGA
jgi:signal transduction histidine kinase